MTPKSLLRHKAAVSPVERLDRRASSTRCSTTPASPDRVRRVLLCTARSTTTCWPSATRPASSATSPSSGSSSSIPGRPTQLASGARPLPHGPRVGLGAGRVAEHGRLDVRGAAAAGADGRARSSTSAATPAPARRPARSWSTTASRPSWSRRRSGPTVPHLVTAHPVRSLAHGVHGRPARSPLSHGRRPDHRPGRRRVDHRGDPLALAQARRLGRQGGEPLFELETDKASNVVPAAAAGRPQDRRRRGRDRRDRRHDRHARPGGRTGPGAPPRPRQLPHRAAQPAPRPKLRRRRPAASGGRPAAPLSPAVRRLVAEKQVDPAAVAGDRPRRPDHQGRRARPPGSAPRRRRSQRRRPPRAPAPPAAAPHRRGRAGHAGRGRAARDPAADERHPPADRRAPGRGPADRRDPDHLQRSRHVRASWTCARSTRSSFQTKHGVGLGFMSFFVKAAIEALKAFPRGQRPDRRQRHRLPQLLRHRRRRQHRARA